MRWRSRRVLPTAGALAAAVALVVVVLADGGDERDQLEAALAYLPADTVGVVALETDLGDEQWDSFVHTAAEPLARRLGIPLSGFAGLSGIEGPVSLALLAQGIDYDSEVEPLLGGELVYGAAGPDGGGPSFPASLSYIAALEVGDTDAAERALRRRLDAAPLGTYRDARLYDAGGGRRGPNIAVDGEVVVVVDSDASDGAELRAAIDRAREGDQMSAEIFERALAGTPEDALIRAYGSGHQIVERSAQLRPLLRVPWFEALEAIGAAASFEGTEVELELNARTDPDAIDPGELPLPRSDGEPGSVRREGRISAAAPDRSLGAASVLSLGGRLFAESRFARDVAAVERDLGIDLEREILRQLGGSGALGALRSVRGAVENDVESLRMQLSADYE